MKYSTKLMATASLGVLMALPVAPASAAVDELIVTARKREEGIQSVPLSVAAFTGDQLTKQVISSVENMTELVAGFEMDRSFNRSFDRPTIRGKSTIFAGSDPSSFFIDGAYYKGSITNIDVSNMQRVEVIKGPQSALFGRSTYAGAINFISKLPGDEFEGNAKLTVGENEHLDVSGRVSGPIAEGILSGGLFARFYENGGQWTSEVDGDDLGEEETLNIQGTLNFTPTDNFSSVLQVYYNEQDDGPFAAGFQPHEFNNYAERSTGGRDYFKGELKEQRFQNNNTFAAMFGDVGEEQEHFGINSTNTFELTDALTMTSITSYDKFETEQLGGSYEAGAGLLISCSGAAPANLDDISCFPIFGVANLVINEEGENTLLSQDLRFDYDNGGPFRALGGLYYYKEENEASGPAMDLSTLTPTAAQVTALESAFLNGIQFEAAQDCFDDFVGCDPTTGTASVLFGGDAASLLSAYATSDAFSSTSEVRNIAAYGRLEWDITEALTVGAEVRYAEDKKTSVNISSGLPPFEKNFVSTSPRLTVDYQLTDDNLLYFVYAGGTKPGGFNTGRVILQIRDDTGIDNTAFNEETIDSFEIGTKNTLMDGQLVLNAAYYYEEVSGYQLTTTAYSDTLAESTTYIDNKGEVEFQGVDLEVIYAPEAIEGLSMRVNYAWNDNEFTKGDDRTQGQIDDVLDDGGLRNCSLGVDPVVQPPACFTGTSHNAAPGSIIGNRTPLSSEHQISAGFDYTRALGNADWDWFTGMNVSYESEKYVQVLNLAEIPASTVVNLNAGIANDNYRFTAWGKNIFDEDAISSGTRFFSGEDFFRRAFTFFPRRGAEWGVSLNANF